MAQAVALGAGKGPQVLAPMRFGMLPHVLSRLENALPRFAGAFQSMRCFFGTNKARRRHTL